MPVFNEKNLRVIKYSEVLEFFQRVGRSPGCPTCPHAGIWNFHVDHSSIAGADATMVFMDIPVTISPYAPGNNRSLKMVTLECPRCGHLEFIQAARILQEIDPEFCKEGAHE